MSTLLVPVRRIDAIKPHPNADRLDLAIVGGWQCVVPKDRYNAGDLITYIPIDSMIPAPLSDELGVTKYLSKGRVRAAKLRGEPSYGVVMEARGAEGDNVAELLGITKYVPPVKFHAGDAEPEHPLFSQYTDVENLRNFTDVFKDGEEVVATEKIHGANCRIAFVQDRESNQWTALAGSRTLQRKKAEGSIYWFPWTLPGVEDLMLDLRSNYVRVGGVVVVYGEVFGRVQSLRYGLPNGLGFRVFDIALDGQYISLQEMRDVCDKHGVPSVPLVYSGAYSLEAIRAAATGKSMVDGADHIREGVVVQPVIPRSDPRLGRVILKYVSDEYLCGDWDGPSEVEAPAEPDLIKEAMQRVSSTGAVKVRNLPIERSVTLTEAGELYAIAYTDPGGQLMYVVAARKERPEIVTEDAVAKQAFTDPNRWAAVALNLAVYLRDQCASEMHRLGNRATAETLARLSHGQYEETPNPVDLLWEWMGFTPPAAPRPPVDYYPQNPIDRRWPG